MTRLLFAVNLAAAIFSGIWLAGHARVRIFDWEFWFALGYLGVALLNLGLIGRARREA